jgi:ubiquinone/menaquinone biosynthesis C-methylase UbiE
MGLYENCILPHVIHLSMRKRTLVPYRRRAIASAEGVVLEIGIGSGLNLALYPAGVAHVIGLDPSAKLLTKARTAAREAGPPVELVEGSAEAIPLETGSVDTVVTTWTLCSIPDVARALGEMRRVLRPVGRLLFVEHGRAPEPRMQKWQDSLTPIWKHLGGGCRLNRAIAELIESAGFRIDRLENGYLHGPNPLTYIYEGGARPK